MTAAKPRSFSPSRFLDFARCGKRYELTRLTDYEEPEAWYFVGGRAVHLATQRYDEGAEGTLEEIWTTAFQEVYDEAFEKDPDPDTWLTGPGYAGRGKPERWQEWNDKGLSALESWVAFRQGTSSELSLVGCEIPFETTLPASSLLLRGVCDRLFTWTSTGGGLVVDLKTGSRKQDSDFQLGVYAVGLELAGYPRPQQGAYFMTKTGELGEVYDLSRYTVELLDKVGGKMWHAIDEKIFLPILSSQCRSCNSRNACYMYSGDTPASLAYDPLHPLHKEA